MTKILQVHDCAEMLATEIEKATLAERKRCAEIARGLKQGQFLDENGKDPEGLTEYEEDCKRWNEVVDVIATAIEKGEL